LGRTFACSGKRNPNIVPCNSTSHCDAQITRLFSVATLNTKPQKFKKEPAKRIHGRTRKSLAIMCRITARARACVRSNEAGRNNAEGGREGLLKTGKNDEGFEEIIKERSHGIAENRLPNEEMEMKNGESQSLSAFTETLEYDN